MCNILIINTSAQVPYGRVVISYKATIVDSDQYYFVCSRYIELNPVRAAMVEAPQDYPWSSYRHNAIGEEDCLITPHQQYLSSSDTIEGRANAYKSLFAACIPKGSHEQIRTATNKSWVLGDERFCQRVAELIERRSQPLVKGRPRGSKNKQS